MPTNHKTSVGFRLSGINIEQFAILEELGKSPEGLRLNMDINFGIDAMNQKLGCFVAIAYLIEDRIGMKLETKCEFQIEPKAWKSFISKPTSIKFNKGFLRHLAMISVGTSRGILHSQTLGSDYNNYPLPTLNVDAMVNNDQSFKL